MIGYSGSPRHRIRRARATDLEIENSEKERVFISYILTILFLNPVYTSVAVCERQQPPSVSGATERGKNQFSAMAWYSYSVFCLFISQLTHYVRA